MTSLAALKRRMMRDPEIKKAYQASESGWQIARTLIEARIRADLTQAQVAKRMGTTQSVVSRMESGHHLPSLSRVIRYAEATGGRVEITIAPKSSRMAAAAKTARAKAR